MVKWVKDLRSADSVGWRVGEMEGEDGEEVDLMMRVEWEVEVEVEWGIVRQVSYDEMKSTTVMRDRGGVVALLARLSEVLMSRC